MNPCSDVTLTMESFGDAVWEMVYSVDCSVTDCTDEGAVEAADFVGWGSNYRLNMERVAVLLAYAADFRDSTPTVDEFTNDITAVAFSRHGTAVATGIAVIMNNHGFDH